MLDATGLSGRLLAGDAQVVDWAGGPVHLDEVKKRACLRRGSQNLLSKLVAERIAFQYNEAGMDAPKDLPALAAGCATVTTGHQLQFPGGPAFFHYKILSAIRLARAVSTSEDQVVPVFWLASEDHDWAEIATVHTRSGESITWQTAQSTTGPVGRMKVDQPYLKALRSWAEGADLPAKESDRLLQLAPEGRTVSDVLRHWIDHWFGDEIIVLDADDVLLKAAAAKLWEAELSGDGIAESVRRRTAELEAAGYSAQAHVRDINMFRISDSGTDRVRVDKSTEIPSEACSPNALLRPLYQEFLLPNAAVVLGPSEAAYWMQLGLAFYEREISRPVLWLRDSGLVLDESTVSWAKTLAWKPGSGWWGPEEVDAAWLRMKMDEREPAVLDKLLAELEGEMKGWAGGVDVTLELAAAASVQRMRKEAAGLKKKIVRAIKRQGEKERAAAQKAMSLVAPASRLPQERRWSALELAELLGGWEALKNAVANSPETGMPAIWVVEKAPKRTKN